MISSRPPIKTRNGAPPKALLGFRVPVELEKRLRELCERKGYILSSALERATRDWLAKEERA